MPRCLCTQFNLLDELDQSRVSEVFLKLWRKRIQLLGSVRDLPLQRAWLLSISSGRPNRTSVIIPSGHLSVRNTSCSPSVRTGYLTLPYLFEFPCPAHADMYTEWAQHDHSCSTYMLVSLAYQQGNDVRPSYHNFRLCLGSHSCGGASIGKTIGCWEPRPRLRR